MSKYLFFVKTFFVKTFFVKQKDEAAPCKVDDHHLSSSNRGKKTGINIFFTRVLWPHNINHVKNSNNPIKATVYVGFSQNVLLQM
jgi:hypothetical protein